MHEPFDVVIVGAGIVGLATAHSILTARPGTTVAVLEKETAPARHQTGRNSGVIHSGVVYAPGSHKALMVADGRARLLRFCDDHAVPYELCGKVVVATEPGQLARLDTLEHRAAQNGVPVTRLDRSALRDLEPHAEGLEALHVPSAGIVSFAAVSSALAASITRADATVRTSSAALAIRQRRDAVEIDTPSTTLRARVLVNCAGLHSDRVAAMAGADTGGIRIMPFRGEYYELTPGRRDLCRNLVYPLPDPAFPFLGVHLTRMIDGSVHAGPNAVPAFAREGYRWRDVALADVAEILRSRGSYRLARRYWRTGAGEIHRSVRRAAFVRALQQLCPEIRSGDLVPSPAGVRAQAIDRTGRLLDDFAFAETATAVHVLNAPSPAATASFSIGREVARRALARMRN